LTAGVMHVAARSLACQGLSIFGDHSDVMGVRQTGFAQLCSASVQEAHDLALISQSATLQARVPFVHFFDGFRTSHEINRITLLSESDLRAMIDNSLVHAHRLRGLSPERPFIRGTSQNPDTYFQARETVNPYYDAVPEIVQRTMDRLAEIAGRAYHLFDYYGDPQAEQVIVLMGSGSEAARETIDALRHQGHKPGMVCVHLYRPFSVPDFVSALPETTASIAVLDRTKEPGATGEPLYNDVVTALTEAAAAGVLPMNRTPRVIGGRYGLSSKEFTPAMIKRVYEELGAQTPRNHFTIGIRDDVGGTSLDYDPQFVTEPEDVVRAIFYGLGSDGTVSANKNTIKIIGEDPAIHAQGYFVYDSKKSGSRTVSHLRFGPRPIRSTYLVQSANFIACHQYSFIGHIDILEHAAHGATFLLNCPYSEEQIWDQLPAALQQQIIEKQIRFYVIDAYKVARDIGLGSRINTVMQTCFFAISGVLPEQQAIAKIKDAIEKTYRKKGTEIVRRNFAAVDKALEHLHSVAVPEQVTGTRQLEPIVAPEAPLFVRQVTARMIAGRGDELPVSMLPADGTYPSGTAAWEKRDLSALVPIWEPDICIQCGNCSFVCPHSVIRSKFYNEERLVDAPSTFQNAPINARGFPGISYTLQIYAEQCTGCGLCIEVCPAHDVQNPSRKAINMSEKGPILASEPDNVRFFEALPVNDRARVDYSMVRGIQYLQPLFEFSGACAGCGETPYLKVLSQLFGDRLVVANATGCSSIYGGNLPTTPWTINEEGRGPAWSNSLFEDNAEFGLGFRLAADYHLALARDLLAALAPQLGDSFVKELLDAPQILRSEITQQRERVHELNEKLHQLDSPEAERLMTVVDHLIRRSVWIVGGDGWAYDIGYGGLDHVLSTNRNVNMLILDTEVYSNTGGQMSKATPLAAVAKFAAGGKRLAKKDLALQAIAYGNVYVARIAMGANPQQTLIALREAEAYPGPSLILAYSHCIAHGIDMRQGLKQQHLAVNCGYWPLIRYNPAVRESGENPFILDSQRPTMELKEYAYQEMRYRILKHSHPEVAEQLMHSAQTHVTQRWQLYEELATRGEAVRGLH